MTPGGINGQIHEFSMKGQYSDPINLKLTFK